MSNQESYRSVLANKPFLALWLGQIFSQLGDRVCFVVFVALVAKIVVNTPGSTSSQSWLYVAFTIPAILLTALAGVFVDRWNKKYTLIITNILRGALLLLLPFTDTTLLGIYALAFGVSAITQFFVPAEAACIPMLVDKKSLLSANSLFTTTMMASLIFGFVLGDPLIDWFGIDLVHYSITALYFISAIFLLGVKEKKCDPLTSECNTGKEKIVNEFFDELKQGLIYIKNTPVVYNALVKLAVLFSIIVALCILSISISSQMLYYQNPALGAQKFVYIVASSGIGMVISAYFVVKVFHNKSKYMLIFLGFLMMGISLMLISGTGYISKKLFITIPQLDLYFKITQPFDLTARMIYTYCMATVLGFGSALIAIPVQTILQTSIPENMRGKVFGVQFTLLSTSSTLPVLLVALAADWIGVSWTLFIMGLPLALFGVYNLYKINKSLKKK